MQTIMISDITLRNSAESALSFKEKIETVKQLENIGVDVIETAPITNIKTDTLFLHTIVPFVKNGILSCPVGYSEESLENAWNAIKDAKKPRLHIMLPTSPVQMEYICHKKPNVILGLAKQLVSKAKELCDDVEFSAMDATRSEPDFLKTIIQTAIDSGAGTITVSDTAGTMLPDEFADFLNGIYDAVPSLKNVKLSVECSNAMSMGAACTVLCVKAGAHQIKTAVGNGAVPSLDSVANIIKMRGESIGICSGLNQTVIVHAVESIASFMDSTKKEAHTGRTVYTDDNSEILLKSDDDIKTVSDCIRKLGYELSEEDTGRVFESFQRVAQKKPIGAKELDAVIASTAMQVPPAYKLKSYVINSGNIITATAHVELEKDGRTVSGISIGDGPIDASFLAIEQIIGHHFELDDFQIQSVTEGREAMGEAVVKLRANGKLYSGRGISTDIIGASIRAYISALNKICYEEA